jgi:ABC-type uncharacterized transport system involved in gliding motility auxiliary subunit
MGKLSKILAIIGFLAAIGGFVANDVLIGFTLYFSLIEIFALLCFILYALINFNIIKKFSKQRSTKYGTTSIIGVLIFVAILVILNIIATYHVKKFDWTRGNVYSLSDQTIKVLKNLESDIIVTAFFKKNSQPETVMRTLIDNYKDYTDKIKIDFVDPDLKPSIAKEYKMKELHDTIFESGDKEYRIKPTGINLEGMVTNAIIKVSRKDKKNIYFLSDHEENSIDDQTTTGYSFVKEHLEGLNYNVNSISLLKEGRVPADCDVLVIVNPKKPLLGKEVKVLDDYVNKNGKFVFLVDTDTDNNTTGFLRKYGVQCNNDIIIDKGSQIFGGDFAMPFVIKYHEEEEITKGFTISTLFMVARSIDYVFPYEPWQKYVALAETNPFPNVWAETNFKEIKDPKFDKGEDLKGPLEIVGLLTYDSALKKGEKQATAEEDENVCEMVIFGDSDFASNVYFNFFGNADFFANTINYLARELDLISITPKKAASSAILLSESQRNFLYYFSIFLLPIAIFAAGIVVWLKRRNL